MALSNGPSITIPLLHYTALQVCQPQIRLRLVPIGEDGLSLPPIRLIETAMGFVRGSLTLKALQP
jgi:hypothetical protein